MFTQLRERSKMTPSTDEQITWREPEWADLLIRLDLV